MVKMTRNIWQTMKTLVKIEVTNPKIQESPTVTKMDISTLNSLALCLVSLSLGACLKVPWISEATKKKSTALIETKIIPGKKNPRKTEIDSLI